MRHSGKQKVPSLLPGCMGSVASLDHSTQTEFSLLGRSFYHLLAPARGGQNRAESRHKEELERYLHSGPLTLCLTS